MNYEFEVLEVYATIFCQTQKFACHDAFLHRPEWSSFFIIEVCAPSLKQG